MTSPEDVPLARRTVRVLDAVSRPGSVPAGAPGVAPGHLPQQRMRVRAARPARHKALAAPPDLWTPAPGVPVCTCGTALRPQDDACSVCGLVRPSGLLGSLRRRVLRWVPGGR